MRKPLLVAAAVVLLATACRAEANVLVDVADDGSGDITLELGLDQELLDLVEQLGGGTESLREFLPEGGELQTRTQGDMTYSFFTERFTDPQDLLDRISGFENAAATFTQLELTVDDGAAELDAVIDAPSLTEVIEGLGGPGLGGFDLGDDFFTSNLVVDLPGSLVESNADEVLGDGRLRWSVPLTGGTLTIHALTSAGGSGFPWGPALGVVGVVLLAGGAIWWSRRNRQSSVDAIAATAAPDAPAPLFEPSASEGGPTGEGP